MTMPPLFQIADQYLIAIDKLSQLDLDEQTIADTLSSLQGDMELKSENVAMFISNLEGSANLIREAAKMQLARADAIEKRADNMRQYLLSNMVRTGISKITCPFFELSIAKNPPKVIIDSEEAIPLELYVHPVAPAPYPDKKLIASKLKAGEDVPGVHLEQGNRLVIK